MQSEAELLARIHEEGYSRLRSQVRFCQVR
jgi:hypothetical protein